MRATRSPLSSMLTSLVGSPELDADELGRLPEDGAFVDGGVWLDEQLVEGRTRAFPVADEEVVDIERDVEGDAAGVNKLPEVELDFAALEVDLRECGRVGLHPEVARLLGPLEWTQEPARDKVLVNEARRLLEVEPGAVLFAQREGLDEVNLEEVVVSVARGCDEHAERVLAERGAEGLVVVDAGDLGVAVAHVARLKLLD